MKEIKTEELAYLLKQAKNKKLPQPIFFLGAGASRTGNIPLAGEIVTKILDDYSDSPFIKKIPEESQNYAALMECLLPAQRDELLKGYIDKAKINVTHIYLAQLLHEGYVDYVLTVNFDNLMLRALALYNIFPATYDMAILKDLTTSTFKEKSVVYLHGQNHGLWLLNTQSEMDKVKATVPRILDSIKNGRPWVFIGYSGEDPIFEHIKNLGRFDNGLYWVTYNDHNPNDSVQEFLSKPNTNAFLVKGYDSDSFMLKLNSELGLNQPSIVDKPFTAVMEMLDGIVDIDDKEHFKGVKERLEISKKQVKEAIQKFELGKVESVKNIKKNTEIDLLKKEIINLIIAENFDENNILNIEERSKGLTDANLQGLISEFYLKWGTHLGALAEIEKTEKAEKLYRQSFEKYEKATKIDPYKSQVYYNWGTALGNLAKKKKGKEAESIYQQAFEKYKKGVEIKPGTYEVFSNWGADLGNFAQTQEGEKAERLYYEAIEKYKRAIEIDSKRYGAFYNLGSNLVRLAKMKEGEEAEMLYNQAFDQFNKAIKFNGKCYNLACLHAIKDNKNDALIYLDLSLNKEEVSVDFVEKDEDWKKFSEDINFMAILSKYKPSSPNDVKQEV